MSDILKRIGGYILIAMLLIGMVGFWAGYYQDDLRSMLECGFPITWLFIWIEKVKKNV